MTKKPMVLLEAANLLSGLSNAIVLIAIPWLVLERTDSPVAAGVVAAVSSALGVLVAPAVGFLIDRFGRWRRTSMAESPRPPQPVERDEIHRFWTH